MADRRALVTVASAQLAAQVAGHVVALRRRRHFDVPFMTGSPEHLVRDWLWFGTAYSAPPYLLAPHVWAVARLVRGPDDRARWVLRWLGTGLTAGYLSERLVRARSGRASSTRWRRRSSWPGGAARSRWPSWVAAAADRCRGGAADAPRHPR